MKKKLIHSLVLLVFLVACSKDGENDSPKGLVSFKSDPVYTNNTLTFSPMIQFTGNGRATQIDYVILDGSSEIESGTASADINDDGMRLWFHSNPVQVAIDGSGYSGKTLVVYLDPDNRVTLPDYTSETYVNTYKKESVTIP